MSRGKSSHRFRAGGMTPSEARTEARTRQFRPDLSHAEGGYTGTVICERCHAIWANKHWHLDEAEYAKLRTDRAVEPVVCPACVAIEREEYDGLVTLRSPLIPDNREAILGLLYNTEADLRAHNPQVRIADLTVHGDTIEVLTISPFLAERLGKEVEKAYHGHVEIKHSPREQFVRVSWWRE